MNIETYFAPLVDLLLKSGALLVLGAALLAAMRKASAANRHTVCAAIFAALLLLPFTKLVAPRWSLASALQKQSPPALSASLPVIATVSQSGNIVSPKSIAIPWKTAAIAAWFAGAFLLLARRGFMAVKMRHVVRHSEEIHDARLCALTRRLLAESGVRAEVRLSPLCQAPCVTGIIRPVALLPVEADEWNDSQICAAMRHELGHIHRRDCLTRLLSNIACALYWINPLVWITARQMRLAQEQACDDLVLNSGAHAAEYADQLVELVRRLQGERFEARDALAMAQPSTLEKRVLAIVDETRDRSPRNRRIASIGFLFLTAALAICSVSRLHGVGESPGTPTTGKGAPATPLPKAPDDGRLFTREWKTPRNFLTYLAPANPAGKSSMNDILSANGITFGSGAAANYSPATDRLIVRNTQAQLDRIDALLAAASARAAAANTTQGGQVKTFSSAPPPEKKVGAALKKADSIIIPKIEVHELPVADVVEFLNRKSKNLDPAREGVSIILKPGGNPNVRITLSLTNIPLSETLRYVAGLAELEIAADDSAITLHPSGK